MRGIEVPYDEATIKAMYYIPEMEGETPAVDYQSKHFFGFASIMGGAIPTRVSNMLLWRNLHQMMMMLRCQR